MEHQTIDSTLENRGDFRAPATGRAGSLATFEVPAEAIVGGGFLVVAVFMAMFMPTTEPFALGPALLATAVLVLFSRAEIEIGASYMSPLQPAFVPMLFLIPPQLVPLFVAGGLLLGRLPDLVSGRITVERALFSIGDAWFAIGPALVLIATGTTEAQGAPIAVLAAAFFAQLAGELAVRVVRELLNYGHSVRLLLRDSELLYLVLASLAPVGFALALVAEEYPPLLLLACPLALVMGAFARERQSRIESATELSETHRGTATLLGMLVEHDDAYTGLHTGEVLDLSVRVAEEMGLSEPQVMLIESAAQLHDVGKIAVPSEIINKAGPLNEEEWEIIKTHTLKGQEMLSTIGGLMHAVGVVVRSCHERYDGKGYPDGLAGEAIPLESRVIFCCDAFNAMTTDRSYRRAMSVEAALDEVQRNAGTQFDPQVAAALQRCVRPAPREEPVRSGRLAHGRALRHPRPQTAAAGQAQSSVAA